MEPSVNRAPNQTPRAEVDLEVGLVRSLLSQQHPDLAHLPMQLVDEGWDNALFRLGDALAVRLPRRAVAATLVEHEQLWLPRLAASLPLPIPVPHRVGKPGHGYPWNWSVVPWLAGQPADQFEPAAAQGSSWGKFLRALHRPAPPEAPKNPLRGVPLAQRSETTEQRLKRLASKTGLVSEEIWRIWTLGLQAPLDVSPTWLHGDLHPRNILVEHGAFSGVIDWGDITAGDPATDLASVWMLFPDAQSREDALTAYGSITEPTRKRAQAWALFFGLVFLDTGLNDSPRNAALGQRILQRLDCTA
jgi:aminoglycoside phosphotransferase (APT) family kinase protein